MENILAKIGSILIAPFILVASLFNPTPLDQSFEVPQQIQQIDEVQEIQDLEFEEEELGAFNTVAGQAYYLGGGGISSSQTTLTLTSFKVPVSAANLTMADFGTIGYITIEPGSATRQEIVSFTGVTQNANGTATLTGLSRGLSPVSPYTSSSTYQKAHSGGSVVVLSNPPQLYEQLATKDNDETITGYWKVPTPLAGTDIANRDYVLSVVNGGAISTDQLVVAGTAGETMATGTIVYFDTIQDEWMKTDADITASSTDIMLGIAQGPGTNGNTITGGVLLRGLDDNQSGMTIGAEQYLSNTAGAISGSAGTISKIVGIARTATTLYFDPDYNYLLTNNQKDALSGGGVFGTPSSSNKFLTQTSVSSTSTFPIPIVRTYLNSGSPHTWTKPAGLRFITVRGVSGAGGGGGITNTQNYGAGGGAGGYCEKTITAASLGTTETVTVGVAGTAGAGTGGDGGAGGSTSFGTHCTITGGAGGEGGGGTNVGGAGGVSTGGDVNITGEKGQTGGGTTTTLVSLGDGGDSMLGKGGANSRLSQTGVGGTGVGYGAGGGGASDESADTAGGPGTQGYVIVTEFY